MVRQLNEAFRLEVPACGRVRPRTLMLKPRAKRRVLVLSKRLTPVVRRALYERVQSRTASTTVISAAMSCAWLALGFPSV